MLDVTSSPQPLQRSLHGNSGSPPATPKQMNSGTLFDGAREVRIDHHGQEYRLRQTRNGKLILTK